MSNSDSAQRLRERHGHPGIIGISIVPFFPGHNMIDLPVPGPESFKARFESHDDKDEQAGCNAYREPQDIDQGITLAPDQVAPGDGKIIF